MNTPWVSFDGKNCGGCKHLNERGYCEFTACIIPCTVSATIPEVKPRTNADKLRAMSDEELAEWMANEVDCQYCSARSKWCTESEETCKRNWLDWLQKEVKE